MAETSWYYYDWQMDGDPAEFAVDTRFFDKAPYENRPVLLHMRCEMKDGTELNNRGRRHIGRLEKKCESDLKALYAGYIEDAYRRVMFFYTDKASRIEALDDMADRERYLYCTAGASDDPEWNTYLNLLYPDAVLMDIKMPVMDGIEALKEIRLHTDSLPVIMQTAYAFDTDRRVAEEAGCNGFITKPVMPRELKMYLDKYLTK